MKQYIYDEINEDSKKGKGNDDTLTSIETAESHRKMKYKNSTIVTIAWKKILFCYTFFMRFNDKS